MLDSPLRLTSSVAPEVEDVFPEDEGEPLDLLDGPEDDMDETFDEELVIDAGEMRTDDPEP
jgi:hypothetical protein